MKFWRLVAGRVNRLRLASVPMCLPQKRFLGSGRCLPHSECSAFMWCSVEIEQQLHIVDETWVSLCHRGKDDEI